MTKKTQIPKTSFLNQKDLWICLFLALITTLVYWQVLTFDFVYDDHQYITGNRFVSEGLSKNNIIQAFTSTYAANWHPITWLSHMLDCEIFGPVPGFHHLTGLIFHLANTLLLFVLFRKTSGGFWQSGLIAALFALHPLHVESTAWIAERKDVLSTFFMILTFLAYSRWVSKKKIGAYLLAIFLFCMGLMAKPMLVTLPFLLLLFDFWPLNRYETVITGDFPMRRIGHESLKRIWEKIPFFILTLLSCIITLYAQKKRRGCRLSRFYSNRTEVCQRPDLLCHLYL